MGGIGEVRRVEIQRGESRKIEADGGARQNGDAGAAVARGLGQRLAHFADADDLAAFALVDVAPCLDLQQAGAGHLFVGIDDVPPGLQGGYVRGVIVQHEAAKAHDVPPGMNLHGLRGEEGGDLLA